jgi:hypothetical protein
LGRRYILFFDEIGYGKYLWLIPSKGLRKMKGLLKNGLRSCLKLVISLEATNENTVQVETVPLKSFQATPLMLGVVYFNAFWRT